jgi:hypothetical protein
MDRTSRNEFVVRDENCVAKKETDIEDRAAFHD